MFLSSRLALSAVVVLLSTAAFAQGKAKPKPAAKPPAEASSKSADCDKLVDHVIRLATLEALNEDSEYKKMSKPERDATFTLAMAEAKKDPEMKEMQTECAKTFSRKEIDCYLKATSMAGVEKCDG
jgi:hypothetical protein